MVKTITYRGIKFRRYDGRLYYTPGIGHREQGIEDLHREVWKHERGPIPDGWHVHHLNGHDDNRVESLECLPADEHAERHRDDASARGREPEHLAHLDRIRPAAAEWHGSPEGIEWHTEHGKRTWDDRQPVDAVCERCGATYQSRLPKRFCSNKCKAADRRDSGVDDVQRTCAHCGAEFTVNRYSATKTCNRKCAARHRRAREREGL